MAKYLTQYPIAKSHYDVSHAPQARQDQHNNRLQIYINVANTVRNKIMIGYYVPSLFS